MTITTYDNVEKWFAATKGSKPAPFWNLYSLKYGRTDQVVHRNVDVTDMQESARLLKEALRLDSENGRYKLSVYAEGQANNPMASVEIQIRETASANGMQGIAGLPMSGYVSINELDQRLENERLKWKVEQLEQQVNAPSDKWERVMETVSGIQGIDKVLQTAILGLTAKFVPQAMPDIMRAINGLPQNVPTGEHADDGEQPTDPEQVFAQNIQQAAATLQTDPVTLARKLNLLIQNNPEMAKTLMQ